MARPTRALFVNSGILGQRTFADYVRRFFAEPRDGVEAVQTVLSDGLTLPERAMRRVLCARLWPDGAAGLRNVDLHRYRCEVNAGLMGRRRIRQLERVGGPFDVLHFHRQGTAYASLARIRRTPAIISCDTTQRIVVQRARTRLEARTYGPNVRRDGRIFAAARLIVTPSRWAAASLREEYPECRTEIAVMPNPVWLPAGSGEWAAARHRRASQPAWRPRVLFVGGDFPRKGGPDLLRVWRDARLFERASLDIVSNWPLDAADLPPGVTIHRGVTVQSERWIALWRDADLFALPTTDEAFGLVFQEASAAALPSVGTRLNAIPELVQDGVTGRIVSPGRDAELAAALVELLQSPDTRRAMGERARRLVAETADPLRYGNALLSAIQRLAGR